jgi:dienelactone hydrolase
MTRDPLDDFTRTTFSFDGKERAVYRQGEGTAVIVMAEIPGITPAVASFARRVVARGHTVYLPHLFGDPGAEMTTPGVVRSVVPACVAREFQAFALRTTAPAIDWLRALARQAHAECGGPGVGAVGMCFTGGFALAMSTEPSMLAPVLSQPSLPIALNKSRAADLACSDQDLLTVTERARDDGLCVLGLRFTGDRMVPAARFANLRRQLGENFIGVEIDSSKGNPWGHRAMAPRCSPGPHRRAGAADRAALEQVLDFLDERLAVGD